MPGLEVLFQTRIVGHGTEARRTHDLQRCLAAVGFIALFGLVLFGLVLLLGLLRLQSASHCFEVEERVDVCYKVVVKYLVVSSLLSRVMVVFSL